MLGSNPGRLGPLRPLLGESSLVEGTFARELSCRLNRRGRGSARRIPTIGARAPADEVPALPNTSFDNPKFKEQLLSLHNRLYDGLILGPFRKGPQLVSVIKKRVGLFLAGDWDPLFNGHLQFRDPSAHRQPTDVPFLRNPSTPRLNELNCTCSSTKALEVQRRHSGRTLSLPLWRPGI